jgi:hypothetical protein
MAKETVYIVLSHVHSLKKYTTDQWEVSEKVEFVNRIRKYHIQYATIIGNYLQRKIEQGGAKLNINTYEEFESYINKKYEKQMTTLREAYPREDIVVMDSEVGEVVITDTFGNERAPTIFDRV